MRQFVKTLRLFMSNRLRLARAAAMEAHAALLPHPSGEAVKTAAVQLGRIRPVSTGLSAALANTVPSGPIRYGLMPAFHQACRCPTSKIRKFSR